MMHSSVQPGKCNICNKDFLSDIDYRKYYHAPEIDAMQLTQTRKEGYLIFPGSMWKPLSSKPGSQEYFCSMCKTRDNVMIFQKNQPLQYTYAENRTPLLEKREKNLINNYKDGLSFGRSTSQQARQVTELALGLHDIDAFTQKSFLCIAPSARIVRDFHNHVTGETKVQTIVIEHVSRYYKKHVEQQDNIFDSVGSVPVLKHYKDTDPTLTAERNALKKFAFDNIFPDVELKRETVSACWIKSTTAVIPTETKPKKNKKKSNAHIPPLPETHVPTTDSSNDTVLIPTTESFSDIVLGHILKPCSHSYWGDPSVLFRSVEDPADKLVTNLLRDELENKIELMKELRKKDGLAGEDKTDYSQVKFTVQDMFYEQTPTCNTFFQNKPKTNWWNERMTFVMSTCIEGEPMKTNVAMLDLDPEDGDNVTCKSKLNIVNVVVGPNNQAQGLSKYLVHTIGMFGAYHRYVWCIP